MNARNKFIVMYIFPENGKNNTKISLYKLKRDELMSSSASLSYIPFQFDSTFYLTQRGRYCFSEIYPQTYIFYRYFLYF